MTLGFRSVFAIAVGVSWSLLALCPGAKADAQSDIKAL